MSGQLSLQSLYDAIVRDEGAEGGKQDFADVMSGLLETMKRVPQVRFSVDDGTPYHFVQSRPFSYGDLPALNLAMAGVLSMKHNILEEHAKKAGAVGRDDAQSSADLYCRLQHICQQVGGCPFIVRC